MQSSGEHLCAGLQQVHFSPDAPMLIPAMAAWVIRIPVDIGGKPRLVAISSAKMSLDMRIFLSDSAQV
jgi:hypothetical protein